MATLDLHNIVKTNSAFNIQAITTSTTTLGNIIDTQGYEGVEFILHSGSVTDGTYTPTIIAGDDPALSDGAAVTDTFLIGTTRVIDTLLNQRPSYDTPANDPIGDATFSGATDSNKTKRIGTVTSKRYVRLNIVSSGITSGGTISAIGLLGWAHVNPTPKD